MEDLKLKPCPFCGGKAEITNIFNFRTEKYRFFATCLVCGIEMPRIARTKEEAIEAWNRRNQNAETVSIHNKNI